MNFDKKEVEEGLQGLSSRILDNFKNFVKEKIPIINPLAACFAYNEEGLGILMVPLDHRLKPIQRVQILKEVVEKYNVLGFVVAYDGYTSGKMIDGGLDMPRKDSLVVLWKTKWSIGSMVSLRYDKETLEFEEPIESKTYFGIWDTVFEEPLTRN